ncbi:dihydrofolate reductase [Halomonas campaniensis]|uniref:Dihydrofolate reductase n=1 Tax=Halomonas campaniensis TaxID=213554 RepID=A0A7W5K6C0_9GAMM|nr:dihydrofolate reductase [Halomonas campaniensis]MBB3332712.1 dihydrofolate reductase [Halomonas campaniensis]
MSDTDPLIEETLVPVAMIAAMDRNRVIGVDNQLPWYLPEDLRFFKRMTQAKPLVMGRRTFQSIGRPLPGRLNIVVTRDPDFYQESIHRDGIRVCHDLAAALALADQQATIDAAEEIMVMGGAQIYAQALPLASRLYLTEVDIEVKGDARFPEIDPAEWEEVQRVPGTPAEGQPDYHFVEYRRRGPVGA